MAFDTIIRGGTIATEAGTFACDIRGEKIAALGDDLAFLFLPRLRVGSGWGLLR
jgi:hypothetical protein